MVVAATALLAVAHLYGQATSRTALTTQNLSRSLELTFDGLIDTIDVALLASADEIGRQMASGAADRQAVGRFLVRQQQRLPHVDHLRATDERGNVLYGPGVLEPPTNNADRDYFLRLRDQPHAGLVIGKPRAGRISGLWVWPFARRIDKPDGSFGGVVIAVIPVREIEGMLARIEMDRGGVIGLRDAEMRLIARYQFSGANPLPTGATVLSEDSSPSIEVRPAAG